MIKCIFADVFSLDNYKRLELSENLFEVTTDHVVWTFGCC